MITLADLDNKIININNKTQNIYKSLFKMFFIDNIPEPIQYQHNTIINNNTYLYYSINISKSVEYVDYIIDIINKNNFVDVDGKYIKGVGYYNENILSYYDMLLVYDMVLSDIDNVLNNIINVFKFNGLVIEGEQIWQT